MKDSFRAGVVRRFNITVGVAVTTETCREAQRIHDASELATIAIGRLLSAATLATFSQSRKGQLSLQVVGSGVLGNLFTDVTEEGRIRTMIKNPQVSLPRLPGELAKGRRSLAHAFREGQLGVIWQPMDRPFSQSTTSLVSGELDRDVEHFLATSEQVRTALAADLRMDDAGAIHNAGGVLLQAMPDADLDAFAKLSDEVRSYAERDGLAVDLEGLAKKLGESIEPVGEPIPLRWQCRCSFERVLGGLAMLGVEDLADMVQKKETAEVSCEFCGAEYRVPPSDVRSVYEQKVRPGN